MLSITLKNGIIHQYPLAKLTLEQILDRLENEIWYLETNDNIEIYQTSEIVHITLSK